MADEAPLLIPGMKFAKDMSLRSRVLGWLQRRRPAPPPTANWTLQHTGGRWVLLLSSYGPGELDCPAGFANSELGPADSDEAFAWAHAALPTGVTHTINRV